jgi:hypothetical protein
VFLFNFVSFTYLSAQYCLFLAFFHVTSCKEKLAVLTMAGGGAVDPEIWRHCVRLENLPVKIRLTIRLPPPQM